MNGKIYTYVGFSIRSGKVKLGVNAVSFYKGKIPLMILCDTATENTKKEVLSLSKRFGSKVLLTKVDTVEDLTNKPFCKLCAVLDENLAQAILDNVDENFQILGGYKS